jgi:hypothetical protein
MLALSKKSQLLTLKLVRFASNFQFNTTTSNTSQEDSHLEEVVAVVDSVTEEDVVVAEALLVVDEVLLEVVEVLVVDEEALLVRQLLHGCSPTFLILTLLCRRWLRWSKGHY